MNINSTEIVELEMPSDVYIVAAENENTESGTLWAVTLEGGVYSLTGKLSILDGFPILLDSKPSTQPTVRKNSLIIPLENKKMCLVKVDKSKEYLDIPELNGSILATPTILNDKIALYDKGFLGKVHVIGSELKREYNVLGIAFGSPALMEKDGDTYTAFITQAGGLSIWCDKEGKVGFPLEKRIWGIYFLNVISNGNYFYGLTSDGMLHRIALDGAIVSVKIPNATTKAATLTTVDSNIYVGIDGNLIYGFNENLELLQGFPIVGTGAPVFADANGDGNLDCFALTIDNKLNAWNLR